MALNLRLPVNLRIPGLGRKAPLMPTPPGAVPGTLVAPPEALPPRITVMAFGPEEFRETEVASVAEVQRHVGSAPVVWVNVDGLGDTNTVQALGEMFQIHPLALEDVFNIRHRPKLEEYDDQLFIMTRMASLGERFEHEQLSMFIGLGYVLTLQERPGDCLQPVRARLREKRGHLRHRGVDYLAYAILDAVVDSYFPVLEEYSERLEALQEEILTHPASDTIARVQAARHDLLALRRSVWPQREFLSALAREETPLITERTQLYLRDAYDHAVRIVDLLDTYREIANGLSDLYLSSVSNRMNDVMKVLTIIATIFIPLTFMAGIYGMNFAHMPELQWKLGYPVLLVIMLLLGVGLLALFRRKGWFGSR
ncbi:MAG: magnesium/cobalt transporter CorA [Gemmatimonadales bacterium]|nr:magnesium/cobalt transporter CorA [Gemmatimonadales bacterium]NIN10915.1 magnesium/cobalt transporter CorA [Gemmatimonadales bacterium]NIN49513.1 magnesium/cobalt transporter CorA [Gemmatimonadales bacterium]NIP06977.1 magnesium/cobalt transporter CorA [Gemmatimonadales bacterium]NIQ99037.1 magnesium/cobalt transporter CorA [Gemmatimonadales bacterium]